MVELKVNKSFTLDPELVSLLDKQEGPGGTNWRGKMNASEAVNTALELAYQDPPKIRWRLAEYITHLEKRVKAFKKQIKENKKQEARDSV